MDTITYNTALIVGAERGPECGVDETSHIQRHPRCVLASQSELTELAELLQRNRCHSLSM